LPDVEDVGGHDANIDSAHITSVRERIHVLDNVVDVLHQTHFDQSLVLDVEGIPSGERAYQKLTEKPHDAEPHHKVDILDTRLRVERQQ